MTQCLLLSHKSLTSKYPLYSCCFTIFLEVLLLLFRFPGLFLTVGLGLIDGLSQTDDVVKVCDT